MTKFFSDFKKYRFLLYDLTKRDFKTKYRRSVLGVLWSVLNPLFMMLILTFVFSHVFKLGISNYPVYYLTGSIIYNFFSESTSAAQMSILANSPLIKKVYMPKYIFCAEKVMFSLINLLLSFVAVIIVFICLKFVPPITILLFPIPVIFVGIFSLGVGLFLSSVSVYFRDAIHLYQVFLTALFYLTPIIFPVSILPNYAVTVMKFNPLYHYVCYFRDIAMNGNIPGLQSNLICFGSAIVMLIIGIIVFNKLQKKFILYI